MYENRIKHLEHVHEMLDKKIDVMERTGDPPQQCDCDSPCGQQCHDWCECGERGTVGMARPR